MKKVKVKIPAKINLCLDVLGKENNFHNIETLVASINLFDVITLTKREDREISLEYSKKAPDCKKEEDNAYKSAKLFMQTFSTLGVDIKIEKNIPISGGLGGSSADIAGVLLGMQKLYATCGDLGSVASSLGSDAKYMLEGGYAILKGKGEQCEKLDIKRKLYFLLIKDESERAQVLSAKNCYAEFDKLNLCTENKSKESALLLINGDKEGAIQNLKNDLYPPAISLYPELKEKINDLSRVGKAMLTGSGATVYGVYANKKELNLAYKNLKEKYKDNLIKAHTL